VAGNIHLTLKPGFEFGFVLITYEETSKNSGESDEYETMKQVSAGKCHGKGDRI
jgi:hypothetical protein